MTDSEIFNSLFCGGNFTLPFLIKFTHPSAGEICLVNDNQSLMFESKQYAPADFTYTMPDTNGNGGTLKISSVPTENELYEFVEKSDFRYRLDVVGAIMEDGTIQKIKSYVHFYGDVTIDKSGSINFSLGTDDRKDMTFPPYIFDTSNNPGNA